MRLEAEVSIYKRNATADGISDAKDSARGVDIYQSSNSFLNYTPSSNTQVYLPTSITLTPTFTGGLTFGAWRYRLGNAAATADWTNAVGANGVTISSTNVLTIVPSSTLFTDSCSEIVFQCVDSTGAFAKTAIVSKQVDARSSYSTTSAAITNINDTISLIASADELSDYSTTNTLASKQAGLILSSDGLLYNAVQSYSILNDKAVALYNSTTNYSTGDYVISGCKFYRSKINSNVGNPPPNAACWDDVSGDFSYENIKTASNQISSTALGTTAIVSGEGLAEPWTVSTQYSVGDLVWSGGKLYKCITAHTSGSTFATNADKWKMSVNGSVVDMFADGISLTVQGSNGSSSLNLASGALNLQTSDIANIIANKTLNLESGVINITGSSAVNIGTSSSGVVTVNSPNFTLTQDGTITAKAGNIGDFEIGEHNLYASFLSADEESQTETYKYIELNTKNASIILRHTGDDTSWNGMTLTPTGINLHGADIEFSSMGITVLQKFRGYDSSISSLDTSMSTANTNITNIKNRVTTLENKTRKSESYNTAKITNELIVYTHYIGVLCYSHIVGKSPVHAAGAASGYSAATGITCVVPTKFVATDENGKRIEFNLSYSGNLSIVKFIDAVTTSATLDTYIVWIASSYPPF